MGVDVSHYPFHQAPKRDPLDHIGADMTRDASPVRLRRKPRRDDPIESAGHRAVIIVCVVIVCAVLAHGVITLLSEIARLAGGAR